MAKILQLSEHVANMIAAGEVVEGPLSVVKELVENAIDAKSTAIEINLIEAGIQKIEVVDNGSGMDAADAIMAFNRHATSKIRNAFDLASIQTLGFRGEALPSIASVSFLELYTKEEGANEGIKISFKAGKFLGKETSACNKGTRIVVSNLFYNTPARLRYLKSPNVILATICELIDKFALANRTIRFKLTNNNQTLLQTTGNDDVINLEGSVYGLNVAKLMHQTQGSYDGMNLNVTFSSPVITRSRKNDITLIVNGRYVKSSIINNAVMDAYKNYVAPLRYPICLLDLRIDPLLIDVNVHPQKMEIKFSMEKEVAELVRDTLKKGLKQLEVIPTLEVQKVTPKVESINFDDYVDFEKPKTVLKEPVQINYQKEVFKENKKEEIKPIIENQKKTLIEPLIKKEEVKNKLPYLEYIGQFGGTYLLFQNDEGLYLIDQHAAQERINYEYYYNVLANPSKESIPLLIPFNLEFKKEEVLILTENLDKLKDVGLVLEPSGMNSFFILDIPIWIKSSNPEQMIEKILYFLLERHDFNIANLRDSLSKQIACKASIKANHFIDSVSARSLISDLEKCENPYNCPHGRPIFVKFTHYEIEKLFKRVV